MLSAHLYTLLLLHPHLIVARVQHLGLIDVIFLGGLPPGLLASNIRCKILQLLRDLPFTVALRLA